MAAGAATLVVLVVLLLPEAPGPRPFDRVDLLQHALTFGVLTILWRLAVARRARLVVALVALGAVTEVLQATLVEGRTGTASDLLADAVGVAVAAALPWPRGR